MSPEFSTGHRCVCDVSGGNILKNHQETFLFIFHDLACMAEGYH